MKIRAFVALAAALTFSGMTDQAAAQAVAPSTLRLLQMGIGRPSGSNPDPVCVYDRAGVCQTIGTLTQSGGPFTLGIAQTPAYTGDTSKPAGSGVTTTNTVKGKTVLPVDGSVPMTGPLSIPALAGQLYTSTTGQIGGAGCLAAEAYGATTTSPDNTAAFNAAVSALPAAGGCVVFGAGVFKFAQKVAVNLTGPLTVKGMDIGVTEFDFTGGTDGFAFNVPDGGSFTFAKATIARPYTGSTASNTGLSIVGATTSNNVTVQDLLIRGNAQRSAGWQTCFSTINLGGPSYHNIHIQMPDGSASASGPTGMSIAGTSSSVFGVDAKLSAVAIQGGHIGLNISAWVQGVFVTNSEMIGDDWPIYWNAPNTAGELITLTNSHLNGSLGGFYGNGISQSFFTGNLVLRFGNASSTWTAFGFSGSNNINLIGNQVYGNLVAGETGISLSSTDPTGAQPNTISGNNIAAINGPGIVLNGTVNQTTTTGNAMNGVLGGGVNVQNCPAWAASTAYAIGQCVSSNNASYYVTQAGTSASSGSGPNATGSVTDGSVTWGNLGGLPSNNDVVLGNLLNGTPDITAAAGNLVFGRSLLPSGNGTLAVGSGSSVLSQIWSNQYILRNGAIASSFTIDNGGNVTLNTAPLYTANAYKETLATPPSSSAACSAGQFTDDANYHYVCVATNTWKRVALSAF